MPLAQFLVIIHLYLCVYSRSRRFSWNKNIKGYTECTQIKFRRAVSPLGNRPSHSWQKRTFFHNYFPVFLCYCFFRALWSYLCFAEKRWNKAKRLFCLTLIKVLIGFAKKKRCMRKIHLCFACLPLNRKSKQNENWQRMKLKKYQFCFPSKRIYL